MTEVVGFGLRSLAFKATHQIYFFTTNFLLSSHTESPPLHELSQTWLISVLPLFCLIK